MPQELSTSIRLLINAGVSRQFMQKVFQSESISFSRRNFNTPIPFSKMLEYCDPDDVIWSFNAVQPEQKSQIEKIARLFACDCAEHLLITLSEEEMSFRSQAVINEARRFASGLSSADELKKAGNAAKQSAQEAMNQAADDWNEITRNCWLARRSAFWCAADNAIDAALESSAWSLIDNDEQEWQKQTLLEYFNGIRK
jgi:hypothetical protein